MSLEPMGHVDSGSTQDKKWPTSVPINIVTNT